jgi:SOS-response transcriptional repressor LexA
VSESQFDPASLIGRDPRFLPVRRIPLLEPYDLGQFKAIARGAVPTSDSREPVVDNPKHGPRMFAVRAYDQSMKGYKNGIEIGDIIFIDPDALHEAGKLLAVLMPGRGRIAVRRFEAESVDAEGSRHVTLAALPSVFPLIETLSLAKDVLQIVGRVVGIGRPF